MGMNEEYLEVLEEMKPVKECPVCGTKPETKTSFKGRANYRNKRRTQVCKCGWSRIIPTEREAMVQLGYTNDE